MELNNIHVLIQRYWNGETSLEDERKLKDYFNQREVDASLEKYADYFKYLSVQASATIPNSFKFKKPTRRLHYRMQAAAAVLLLVVSLFFYQQLKPTQALAHVKYEDTYKTPEEALVKLKEALVRVSVSIDESQKITKGKIKKVEKALLIIK